MKALLTLLMIGAIASCNKSKIVAENQTESKIKSQLIGKWKAVGLFLSDANTGVCHQEKSDREITFEFNNELAGDKINYSFNGNAPVNSYFGTITFNSFDETNKIGKIKINTIGSTKMAGRPEMMECELNFLTMLHESTSFQLFDENPKRLIMGKLRDENSHPRDGGTYYIFEKSN